jgi:hypothetical protein
MNEDKDIDVMSNSKMTEVILNKWHFITTTNQKKDKINKDGIIIKTN